MKSIKRLALSWSVSRGRDTYGYNICRLDDTSTGDRFKCMGGGYDMQGTVFGEWLAANYQPELLALKDRASYVFPLEGAPRPANRDQRPCNPRHAWLAGLSAPSALSTGNQ